MYEVVKVPPFTGRPFLRLTPGPAGLHHQTNMKKITKQQIIQIILKKIKHNTDYINL